VLTKLAARAGDGMWQHVEVSQSHVESWPYVIENIVESKYLPSEAIQQPRHALASSVPSSLRSLALLCGEDEADLHRGNLAIHPHVLGLGYRSCQNKEKGVHIVLCDMWIHRLVLRRPQLMDQARGGHIYIYGGHDVASMGNSTGNAWWRVTSGRERQPSQMTWVSFRCNL